MEQSNGFYVLKVPIAWKTIYAKLLTEMSKLGVDMLKDCNASCSGTSKQLISCWNMFNVACAAYEEEQYTLANILIQEIVYKLDTIYGLDLNPDDYVDCQVKELDYPKVYILDTYNPFNKENNYTYNNEIWNTFEEFYELIKDDNYTIEEIYNKMFESMMIKLSDKIIYEFDNYKYLIDEEDLFITVTNKDYLFGLFVPNGYGIKNIKISDGEFSSILYDYEKDINESVYVNITLYGKEYYFYFSEKGNRKIDVELYKIE